MNQLLERMTRRGVISEEASRQADALIAQGLSVDEALLKQTQGAGGLTEERLLRCLSEEFGVPMVELDQRPPAKEFLAQFPVRILMTHSLVPLEQQDGVVLVATSRIFDTSGLDELRLATGRNVRAVLATSADINRCLKSLLGVGADTLQSLVSESADAGIEVMDQDSDEDVDLSEAAEDASIIKFVNQVVSEAIERRATDVHFEPFENAFRVRYRVDGVLQEANIPQEVRQFQPAIVSRLKILSHLDIAEKRLPQ
ncbi:MAG: GspE/PulE family protein, partial [Phycisphaerae bacterium]